MCKKRLDSHEKFPSGFEEYLEMYGWHFSKKMCEYAVSRMKKGISKESAKPIKPMTKDEVEELLKNNGINCSEFIGYDHVYVANMCKADYLESSIEDNTHLALFVKDYLSDPDGYTEVAMSRYYADCIRKGEQPIWEDMI